MKQKIFPLALLSSIFVYAPLALASDAIVFPDDSRIVFPSDDNRIFFPGNDSSKVNPDKEKNVDPKKAASEISEAGNRFGIEIYKKLVAANDGKNIFFSNYSVHSLLSALREGADGPTAIEMQSALHLPEDKNVRYKGVQRLNQSITDNTQVKLSVTNALWAGVDIKEAYQNAVAKYYNMSAKNAYFNDDPEEARRGINWLVKTDTGGKIKDLLPFGSITQDTPFVLTNAVYFKGDWLKKFEVENTLNEPDNFSLTGDGTASVSMMNATFEKVKYGENGNTQILELPYKGKEVSMLIMLPIKGKITNLEQNLDNVIKTKLEEKKIEVFLPKFKLETNYELRDSLFSQMPSVFSNADFSNIADGPLRVEDVFHKAFVEVDEEGTEAAAATAVLIGRSGVTDLVPNPEFKADRPFIFAIKHNKLDTILFMGKVEDPTQ